MHCETSLSTARSSSSSRLLASISLTASCISARISSASSFKVLAGVYRNSFIRIAGISQFIANDNVDFGPQDNLSDNGFANIVYPTTIGNLAAKSRLSSVSNFKIGFTDKFAGDKPNFRAYEKLYPISNPSVTLKNNDHPLDLNSQGNDSFEEKPFYDYINGGIFTDLYTINNEVGFLIADDESSIIFTNNLFSSGDIKYKFEVTTPFAVAKNSYFAIRSKAPFDNYLDRKPQSYSIYDIKLEDPSGNLIIKYNDVKIKGDNQYSTYVSSPTVNNLLLPTWDDNYPIMILNSGYTLQMTIKYDCAKYPFNTRFNESFEESCVSSYDNTNDPLNHLYISAIEIGNSGGVGILRDNYLNIFSKVTNEPNRVTRTLLPSELLPYNFTNGIYPEASGLWSTLSNEIAYTNIDASGSEVLLSKIRNYHTYEYITLNNPDPIKSSGRLILKFNTKPEREYYGKNVDGAFDFGGSDSFNDSDRVSYKHNDNIFNVDKIELRVIAKKASGGSNYVIDAVGYSDDKLLCVTSPVGGFLQNSGSIPFDSSQVPDISGFNNTNLSISNTSFSDNSNYFQKDVSSKGDHYALTTNPIINSTSFEEYIIPLEILQDPNKLGYTNYYSSSFFENLYLDIAPLASGASIANARLVIYYRPANAIMMHTCGGPNDRKAIRSISRLYPQSNGTINSSTKPTNTITGYKVGYPQSNYSRRWRGNTGSIIIGGDFNRDTFDFSFNHVQSNTPFLTSYVDFTKIDGPDIYDHKNNYFAQAGTNLNIASNFGWRYSSDQLIDGVTTDYTSIAWNNNIYDSFDRALSLDTDTALESYLNLSDSFVFFLRYTPSHVTETELNNHLILSYENASTWGLVLVVEDGYITLKIRDANNNIQSIVDSKSINDYILPISIVITYNVVSNIFTLYTDDPIQHIRGSTSCLPISLSSTTTYFNFSQRYNSQSPIPMFLHEIGYSNVCNILPSNPNTSLNEISISEFFDSYNVIGDTIDDNIDLWHLGDFKVCEFSPDFDFYTKRYGLDYVTFKLEHSGSGYFQYIDDDPPSNINLSGVAYHSQIENDFLRFNLSSIPTVDKERFYAVAPRICKTIPRGYQFNEEAICVDTILEHETNSDIKWSDGKRGPKLIVSLYTTNQNLSYRPSKDFGLVNRSIHYLEPSGCIQKVTSKFTFDSLIDESEPWSVFDPEIRNKEFKERYFSKDIDDMFLQYDLVYPSGPPISSLIKLHSANVRIDDCIMFSDIKDSSPFNLYVSGFTYQLSYLNLFNPLSSSGSLPLPLFVAGDRFFSSGNMPLYVNSETYFGDADSIILHTHGKGSISTSELLFGDLFGSSPQKGLNLFSCIDVSLTFTGMPLHISPYVQTHVDSINLHVLKNTQGIFESYVPMYARGSRAYVNPFPSSVMSLFVNSFMDPVMVSGYSTLYVSGEDPSIKFSNQSMNMHTLNYPISDSLSRYNSSIKWDKDNVGSSITDLDNSYAYVDADDNIRGVKLTCFGNCMSSNRCYETIIDIHGIKWYYPESCVDGGIFRPRTTYTNLTFPSGSFKHSLGTSTDIYINAEDGSIITNEDGIYLASEQVSPDVIYDPMPYSGHFYGIRKYSGLAPNLPYLINLTGKTGSIDPINIPTEIIDVEYNKNEDDNLPVDYTGLKLIAPVEYRNNFGEFAKSIASKEDLLVVGSPKVTLQYSEKNKDGDTITYNLEEAGAVFLYQRQQRPSGSDWPLNNYKSPWNFSEVITLPSGLFKDYSIKSSIVREDLPFGLIQTSWFVGQEGRQFGHSVDLAINRNKKSIGEDDEKILVVGGPSAKWSRTFDTSEPSGVNIALFVFTDEFIPRIPIPTRENPWKTKGYEEVLASIKNKDLIFNYLSDPRIKFNVKLIILQPIADSPDIIAPSFPDKPDFIVLKTMGRNLGIGNNPTKTNELLESMKSAFFEAFPFIDDDPTKVHNNIPPFVGLYIDNSSSLGRESLEPAIDQFINFYKDYSFASGLRDFYGIRESGQVIEYVPNNYDAEDWVDMSRLILSEVLDTGNLIENNRVRFLTQKVGIFNENLNEFNVPPDSGGKVYVFEKESGIWNLIQEIKSSNVTYSNPDRFGHSVSISDNAEVIAIGSPYISQAVMVYEKKPEQKDLYYSMLPAWMSSKEKYASALEKYYTTFDREALYLTLDKEDKFQSRVELGIQEYQNIFVFDYQNMQPKGSWSFIPHETAPTSRLGYSVDVNEDGSIVVAGAPTDSLNLYNDADVYHVSGSWKGKTFRTTYYDVNEEIPSYVKPSWSSTVNAGSIHVFESRKYYPHNKAMEYGIFGNLHQNISNNTLDSGHFHYLSTIFSDKQFTKSSFDDPEIPIDVGLLFIITPSVQSLSDEVYNNIVNWLALGDRNLVLVGNDPLWEASGIYQPSNDILNKLLERLDSRMRITKARNQYESLPNGYTSFNNIVPSFVPQGSTATYTRRSSVRGSGVGDIKIYWENGYSEYMPCKLVDDCTLDGGKVQIQSKCEMPLLSYYGDMRAQWNASCCATNGGMIIYGYNWPLVFGSYAPMCGDSAFESKPTANFEPIPLLVAAENITQEIIYPAVPAKYIRIQKTKLINQADTYYSFGSSGNLVFMWDSGNTLPANSFLTYNINTNLSKELFYKPEDGLLQARGISTIDIAPFLSKEKVSDKGYFALQYPFKQTTSTITVLSSVETESKSVLLSSAGDQNIKFYTNLVSKSKIQKNGSRIAQLGGWTGRKTFRDGFDESYLRTAFYNSNNEVTENVITLLTEYDVCWIANINSQPSANDLKNITDWLNTGNKKLIITCGNSIESINAAKVFCNNFDVEIEPLYLPGKQQYAIVGDSLAINPNHQVGGKFFIPTRPTNEIEYFYNYTLFHILKLTNNATPLAYSDAPVFDEVPKENINTYWDTNTGTTKLTIPVIAGSGYRLCFSSESLSPSEIAPIEVFIEHASMNPKLPYPDMGSNSIFEIDQDGNQTVKLVIDSNVTPIRLQGDSKSIDVQAAIGATNLNIYFNSTIQRVSRGTTLIPKTTKLIGVSGFAIPVETNIALTSMEIPIDEYDLIKVSDAQDEERVNINVIRPISTDNSKYCTSSCTFLGGQLIEDGPVVAAQELEILSNFEAGVARSRITVLSDSSMVQGRYMSEAGLIPQDTYDFIRSLYPETNFPSTTYGRQFDVYNKLVSPERGSPAKYYSVGLIDNLRTNFGNFDAASSNHFNEHESKYIPEYITRPKIPWEDETDEKEINYIKNVFISGLLNQQSYHGSTTRFSGIIDGITYLDATIGGGLPQLLKDKQYDYLDFHKFPSGYLGDLFGYSVCIRKDKILAGSPLSAFNSEDKNIWSSGWNENSLLHLTEDGGAGATYMFQKTGPKSWQCNRKFRPNSLVGQLSGINTYSDRFGTSVDMLNDTIIIGSPSHGYDIQQEIGSGAFAKKNFNPEFDTPSRTIHDLAYSGVRNELDISNSVAYRKDAGAIYVYENKITDWENKKQSWELVEKITSNSASPSGERYGNTIILSRPYRTDADYTIFASCLTASGNSGIVYSKDIMLKEQPPSLPNSGAWISAKAFGYRDLENEPTVELKFSNIGNNFVHYSSGIIVANENGEIFLEVSGQDPSTKGFITHRPYIESILGQYQYGRVLENSMILIVNGQFTPPSSEMPLFMKGKDSAYVYNTLGLHSSVVSGVAISDPSMNLFVEFPSGSVASGINLFSSGIGIDQTYLNMRVRGK